MIKRYNLKEAQRLLDQEDKSNGGKGVTYKTLLYYRDIYNNDVFKDGRYYYVTDAFLDKIRNNREKNSATITHTKSELVEKSQALQKQVSELREEVEKTKIDVDHDLKNLLEENKRLKENALVIPSDEEGIYDLISDLIYKLRALGNTDKIEVFSEEEYNQFQDALREYKHLEKNIKQQEVYFEEIKASKDEVIEHYKNQFEYQRRLADKQLEQMDTLLTYLKLRGEREAERQRIEAVEKRVIPKEPKDI